MSGCNAEEKLQHVKDIEILKTELEYLKEKIGKLDTKYLKLSKLISQLSETNTCQNESITKLDASITILNNQFDAHTKNEIVKTVQTTLSEQFDYKQQNTQNTNNKDTIKTPTNPMKVDGIIENLSKITLMILSIVFFLLNNGSIT